MYYLDYTIETADNAFDVCVEYTVDAGRPQKLNEPAEPPTVDIHNVCTINDKGAYIADYDLTEEQAEKISEYILANPPEDE